MKKKHIILLAALVLLLIIPVMLFIQGQGTEPVKTTITPKKTTAPTKAPTTTIPATSKFQTYQDPQYTLSFPPEWTYTKNPLSSNAGVAFMLQPPNASRTTRPHILVKLIDTTVSSVEKNTTEFRVFKYRKTTEQIAGKTVTKYQQELPSPDGTMQSTGYVLQSGTKLTIFRLGYFLPTRDQGLETDVTQMVAQYIATN